jgi:hypothetical protein
VNVESLFAPVVNDLVIMKEVAGYGIYWPEMGINNLGTLNPGEAYYVRMEDEASLTFGECLKNVVFTPEFDFQTNPAWNEVVKTPANHVIGMTEKALADCEAGDYIGVFTPEGNCAGQIIIDDEMQQTALVAFGKDAYETQQKGFDPGEGFTFKLYVTATGDEYDLIPEYDLSQPAEGTSFTENGMSVVTGFKVSETGISGVIVRDIILIPNPTTGKFAIQGINEDAEIEVIDMNGQLVPFKFSRIGKLNEIDLTGRQPGLYIVRISRDGHFSYKKLILK